jgi:hypothetical protein
MGCTLLIALGLISKAFLLNESIKNFLVIFFFVGCGVGSLRLFVNSQIKKMKGKGLIRKILFFAVLLGVGIPFQNWFRVNVIMTMNRAFMPWNISIMVTGAIFITTFFGFIKDRMTKEIFNLAVIEEAS